MKIVVAGQKTFGAAALAELVDAGHHVAGVVSPVAGDRGRRDPLTASAVARSLPWSQDFREGPVTDAVRSGTVDLIVAAHSHSFIGARTRSATRLGALGYHPSLLPRHRGRDAVRWTIKMGDRIAGGSVYWFTDNVDGGPIAAQQWCHVDPAWTASDLWAEELFPMGLRLLTKTLAELDRGVLVAEPQEERYATWEPAFGAAPLHRPELPELGAPAGYRVKAHRGAAR